MNLWFPVAAVLALALEYAIFGHGWNGIPRTMQAAIALGTGLTGILIGAGLSAISMRILTPRSEAHGCVLRGMSGLGASILTFAVCLFVIPNCWDYRHINGDAEAFIWCVTLCSLSAGVLAVPFGCGLGTSKKDE